MVGTHVRARTPACTPRPLSSSTLMRRPLGAGARGGSPLTSPSLTCGLKIDGGMKVEKLLHYSAGVRTVTRRRPFRSRPAAAAARREEGEPDARWEVFCKRRKLFRCVGWWAGQERRSGPSRTFKWNERVFKSSGGAFRCRDLERLKTLLGEFSPASNQLFIKINEYRNNQTCCKRL